MKNAKYHLYRLLRSMASPRLRRALAQSPITRQLREKWIRPRGAEEIVEGDVSFEGIRFRFAAPYPVFYHAESSGIEARISRLALSVLSEGATAVDVGANCGFLTLLMARCVGPGGKVFSFECHPPNYRILTESVRKNAIESYCEITTRPAAQHDEDPCITVDTVVIEQHQSQRVDFMKVDVDGGDYNVLLGAREVLSRFHPVVVTEMSSQQEDIYNLLREAGYTHFMDTANRLVTPQSWPENMIAATRPVSIPKRGFRAVASVASLWLTLAVSPWPLQEALAAVGQLSVRF